MYLFIDAMIEQRSFKIKVDGKAKTIDTVVDTDQTQKILEGADPDVNENIFEPRTKNRFLVKLLDQNQNELIPSYLIREIQRPEIYMDEFQETPRYSQISIGIYDSASINLAKILNPQIGNKLNINLQILGPVGDVLENWYFENVRLTTIQYSNFNWANDDLAYINVFFDTKTATIKID
jgi:hypothetical protein